MGLCTLVAKTAMVTCCLGEAALCHLKVKMANGSQKSLFPHAHNTEATLGVWG